MMKTLCLIKDTFGGDNGLFKSDEDYWIGLNIDDDKVFNAFSKESIKALYQALKKEFEND